MCVHLHKTAKFSLHFDVSRKLAIAQTYTRTILFKFPKHSERIKLYQGYQGLRKITRGLEVPNHEILGDQHLSLNVKKNEFFQSQKAKVRCQWHPWALRTQACTYMKTLTKQLCKTLDSFINKTTFYLYLCQS